LYTQLVRRAGFLLALTLFVGGDAVGATAPTLAISATGVLGDSDTIVIAITNPSNRVDIEIPQGYAFPQPAPQGGHAFISFSDGTGGGRATVSALASPPATDCAGGRHDQVWEYRFSAADVVVFLSGRDMTICPLPPNTDAIVVASKYWSTPQTAGAYTWRATTAGGAQASTTIRLPVRLTLAQIARRPKVRLRARLTENGSPVADHTVLLAVSGRSLTEAPTRPDGSVTFTLRLRRRAAAYVTTALGADAREPHTLRSNRITVRPG
jgi:hypothetical protein